MLRPGVTFHGIFIQVLVFVEQEAAGRALIPLLHCKKCPFHCRHYASRYTVMPETHSGTEASTWETFLDQSDASRDMI